MNTIKQTHLVETLISIIYALSLIVASLSVTYAADAPVEIIFSSQVQEVLNKGTPDRNEKMKKAISVGNRLLIQLLDFSAYTDSVDWQTKTGTLLAMKAEGFHQMVSGWGNGYLYLQVCPNVRLIALKENAQGEVDVSYQTTSLGILTFDMGQEKQGYAHFDDRMKGNSHLIVIRVNANSKVSDITPQDNLTPEIYQVTQADLKSSGLRQYFYQDDTHVRIQARKASYDQAINEMDKTATEVCKFTSSNSTKKENN